LMKPLWMSARMTEAAVGSSLVKSFDDHGSASANEHFT
jgi:hypothetical protein